MNLKCEILDPRLCRTPAVLDANKQACKVDMQLVRFINFHKMRLLTLAQLQLASWVAQRKTLIGLFSSSSSLQLYFMAYPSHQSGAYLYIFPLLLRCKVVILQLLYLQFFYNLCSYILCERLLLTRIKMNVVSCTCGKYQ